MKAELEDLIERVGLAHETAESVEALARGVRAALREHIVSPGFQLDCLERMLSSPALADPELVWGNPPIHADRRLNYQFRIFFWGPGYANSPHRHNTWSVTGVLHDQCNVFIYAAGSSPSSDPESFVVERRIVARAGEVGYLLPGCTHSVGNPGDSISATFHVFSASRDVEQRDNDTIWYPTRRAKGGFKDGRFRALRGSVEMLAKIQSPRSLRLLDRILQVGGPKIRLACIRAITAIDPSHALSRSGEFYALLPASSHEDLGVVLAVDRPSAQLHSPQVRFRARVALQNKRNPLNHFRALQPVLSRLCADAFLDPCTFVLRMRASGVTRVLYPQFMAFTNGVTRYITEFNADAARFAGWYPYLNRRWPLASQKLLFKEFAVRNSLRTPEFSTDPAARMDDVLVKRSVSSFAADIQGPFHSSAECALNAAAGEYFERFVRGKIAKIWYWNDLPVCLELQRLPFVTGNGRATIRQLLRRRLKPSPQQRKKNGMRHLVPFLKYEGVTLDSVPESGREQAVDFRYGSRFLDPGHVIDVDLVNSMPPELEAQLRETGEKLWRGIPDTVRDGTLFTVDAIVDDDDRIWVLEMNSNPFIHPYLYPVMLDGLFAAKKGTITGEALAV